MNLFKNTFFKQLLIIWLILLAWESNIFLVRLVVLVGITYWFVQKVRTLLAVRQFNKRAIENFRKIHGR